MNDRCNRTDKQNHGEYMGSGNRKANPWGNTVMGSSEIGVIQGLSVSQDWVLVKVTLGVDLGRDEGTHGKRTGERHQCRGTH